MTVGEQLAFEGQEAALTAAVVGYNTHVGDIWNAICERAAHSAEARTAFSADDIRAELTPETVAWIDTHHRAWSALWARARRDERIEAVGWTDTKRRQRHGNPNRLWRGTRNA
jgi:hypothetical protein